MVNLTCTQRWVQYLQLLQESIWPGGVLPAVPKPARTEEQKKAAAEQALQSLMGILPGKWAPETGQELQVRLGNPPVHWHLWKYIYHDGVCLCQGTEKCSQPLWLDGFLQGKATVSQF